MKNKNNRSIKRGHTAGDAKGQSTRNACIDIAGSDESLLFIEGAPHFC